MTDKEKIEESNKVIQKRYEVIEDLFTVGKKISYYQENIGKTPCIISNVRINARTLDGIIELTPTIVTGKKITIIL